MAAMCQYLGRSVDCRRVCGPPVSNREATVRHVPRPVSSSVVVCSTRTVSCNTMSVNAASVAAVAEVADPMTRSRGKVVELSTATFDWFLQQAGDTPVVVDFFTDWCGPCKLIAPVVAESAQELPGVRFAKFNCGTNDKRFAVEKQIKALPTFHVYHKGQKVGQFVGAKPRDFRRWAQSVGVDFGAAK